MESNASAIPSLLPGQSPPLFTITSSDQSGIIVIVTGVCLVTAVFSVLVRAYLLLGFRGMRTNWDDWAIAIALVFAAVQSALVEAESSAGLGRTIGAITSDQARKIQLAEFADQIFFIICVWVSKLSVALFFLRLSPLRSNRFIAQGVIAIVAMSGIAVILVATIVCDLSQPWQYFTAQGLKCTAPYNRWLVISIIDIVTEVALAAIAIRIIWSLQIRRSKKFGVAFAFLQRLVIVAPIVARLHYLSIVYKSDNVTLHAAYSTICKQTEVAFSIVAASIPCLKPFLRATATHYGAPAEGAKSAHGKQGTAAGSTKIPPSREAGWFHLRNLNLSKREATQSLSDNDRGTGEPSDLQQQSHVTGNGDTATSRNTASVQSDSSKKMVIRKDVRYNVECFDLEHGHLGDHV